MSKTQLLLQLLDKGYRLYTGQVPDYVYVKKRCPHPESAEWVARPMSKEYSQSSYVCFGCDRQCVELDPTGWQILLPVQARQPSLTAFVAAWPASAEELIENRLVLRVDEAAWVLNVSTKTIYRMLQEGKLRVVEGNPVRVTTESLRPWLTPLEYTGPVPLADCQARGGEHGE